MTQISITWKSRNSKTGPIPTTMSESKTCPDSCPLKSAGCYAELGHVRRHWNKLDAGEIGFPADHFPHMIRAIEPGQIWRHNVAGDLQGDGVRLDADHLAAITEANKGRRGFTYTHYSPMIPENRAAIAAANAGGFTVNLSANNLRHADTLAATGAGPVAAVLPYSAGKDKGEGVREYRERTRGFTTPQGRKVVVCPATYMPDVNCQTCKLCAVQRAAIVGFPAHGQRKRKASEIAQGIAAE